MARGPWIIFNFGANVKPLQDGVAKAEATAKAGAKSATKSVAAVGAGVLAGGLATKGIGMATDFFTGAVKNAMAAEQANARFATTLRNIGHASDGTIKSVNDFLGVMSKQGAIAKGELRPAFETLLRSTGSVSKAEAALKVAMDTAAGSGKPLAAVSLAIGKAYNGSTGALQKLGIKTKEVVPNTAAMAAAQKGLRNALEALSTAQGAQTKALAAYNEAVKKHGAHSKEAIAANERLAAANARVAKGQERAKDAQDKVNSASEKTKSIGLSTNNVMKNLAATFKGQASKQADTAAGRMKNAQLQFKAFQTTLGTDLMPVLASLTDVLSKTLLPVLQTFGDILKKHPALIWPIVAAVIAWNIAMNANPLSLIVLAIIAFVGAIILAYKKVKWFHDAVDAFWQGLQTAWDGVLIVFRAVFNWIKTNWPLLLGILLGPFGLVVVLIIKNWDAIWAFLKAIPKTVAKLAVGMWHGISDAFHAVVDAVQNTWNAIWDWFSHIPGDIARAASGMWHGITDAFKSALNLLIDLWNRMHFKVGGWKVGPVSVPTIDVGLPHVPHLAQGGITRSEGLAWLHPAEVITPMSSMPRGDTYITVNVPPTANPLTVGKAVVDAIRAYENVAGTSWRMSPTGT